MQNKQAAFDFIDKHQEEMISLWREVVSIESGPHEKPGIDTVAVRFRNFLEKTGAACRSVDFSEAGNMLIAEIGAGRFLPGVLFLGHQGLQVLGTRLRRHGLPTSLR